MDPSMPDPGFPSQTATATAPSGGFSSGIRFDPSYIRTVPGILKIAQLVFNIVGYIFIVASYYPDHPRAEWFDFVSMSGFWLTGILLLCYLLHVVERFQRVPWIRIELGYTALWSFFYLTCSTACAVMGHLYPAWAGAAFFGYVAMFLYGADAFFKFRAFRAGDVAQGERPIPMEQVAQSPGAY